MRYDQAVRIDTLMTQKLRLECVENNNRLLGLILKPEGTTAARVFKSMRTQQASTTEQ